MASSQALDELDASGTASPPTAHVPNGTSRYFDHPREEREALLRQQVADEATSQALEAIFQSGPWTTQTGELDRFQLHHLLRVELRDGKDWYCCKFVDCDYSNGEPTNAIEHVRGHHFGNRPFLCFVDDCDKGFTRRWDLQIHQRTHSNEVVYTCRYCDMNFTRKTNGTRHEVNYHPDEYEKE